MTEEPDIPPWVREVVDLLLGAYFFERAADRGMEYLHPSPDPAFRNRRGVEDLAHYSVKALAKPALLLRNNGPAYLRSLSFTAVRELLRGFVRDHYWQFYSAVDRNGSTQSFAAMLGPAGREKIAGMFAFCELMNPPRFVTAFPITPMRVEKDFDGGAFYLIDVASITTGDAGTLVEKWLHSPKEKVKAWLGVRAPQEDFAKKIRRIVLGAVALSIIQRERHMFVIARMIGNYLTFRRRGGATTTYSLPHTPPLGSDIRIGESEHVWLGEVARLLNMDTVEDKRKCKALEYYYRAWFQEPSERCASLFMALDAAFGQGSGGYATIMIPAIQKTLEDGIDERRLRELLNFRSGMVHGKIPDIYSSSQYSEYIKQYDCDPAHDAELLIAKCLRLHLFGRDYTPQPDPAEEIIREFEAKGGYLPAIGAGSVVTEWP
jgi:hypothetical protein